MSDLISINYDLDLFAKCDSFTLHFATAGGVVPNEIFSDPLHNEIRAQLLNKNETKFKYKLNPAIDDILLLKFEAQGVNIENFNRDAYFRDFIFYAELGCFSFDRTYISEHHNNLYHLVAYPIFETNDHFPFGDNEFIDNIVEEYFNRPQRILY